MKRIFPLLCIAVLTLALTACNQEPSVKIGIVDEAAAFKDNKVATEAMAYLQELGKPLQAKAESAYKAMQENQTEETVAAYKLAMGELQSTMNAEQQRVVAMVDAKFSEVLATYREEKGLTLILSKQSVISASEAVDITSDIVVAMNALSLDFTKPAAVQAEEVKPEAEAEKAAATEPEAEKATVAEPEAEKAPAAESAEEKAAE
ncbi:MULTISPECIES: OmpH family outer membrane protein [unclassified Pseudodesulfovibrio]|uniref:OmpH family outer membrane protein n=1 Tax=unclassified Pseudodesulfovibrio TaxID=2661612 RepID=UPI000FEBE19A|nr:MULTISPECIES: OmpH family outer membrane protein [unclassified Pseudodesulfovibrio]MCJ2165709.1 OmpH family outer membrane protein [Pseudodesulfovibrio sp. S3-i]RWU02970.1 OmpH family outer membrane protein [Pseudodesulfovibrio sp. S3]